MGRISTKRLFLLLLLTGTALFLYTGWLRHTTPTILPRLKAASYLLSPPQPNFNLKKCLCDDLKIMEFKDVAMEMETNEDVVVTFLQGKNVTARKGFGRRRETLDPEFEAPLFRYPPLRHSACLPDHRRSKVTLLTPADQIPEGSKVRFRIDLYTSCGQPRYLGGDVIRAWLKQPSPKGTSAVAAKVKDLQNGSYVGETFLPWPGVTFVQVSLTYAREFLCLSVEMSHTLHAMRWSAETMENGRGLKEDVACLPSTPVPGYAKACNFTSLNSGLPWFCGYPVTKGLACHHRTGFKDLNYMEPLPIPPMMQDYVGNLTRCCSSLGNMDLRLIKNDIALSTFPVGKLSPESAWKFPPPLPPCHTKPPLETWLSPSPRGWLRHGQWFPSTCQLPHFSMDDVQRCMRNKTLLLVGDSNQRMLWHHIRDKVGCGSYQLPPFWNSPHVCQNPFLRSSVLFAAHAMPFTTGTHGTLPVHGNLPLPQALHQLHHLAYHDIDDITVVIHYQMHLAPYSVQVYRNFVQAARRTVQEYLKLHPKVRFVIRGPHVLYHGHDHHVHTGDKFGDWYQKIWKDEFGALSDRVWYLDTWDMTIADENWGMHPMYVLPEIMRVLFGYICDGT